MKTADQAYLAERKQARVAQESIIDQPENTEAVDVSEDAPVDEVIETEAQANEEVTTETEEPAEETPEVEATEEDTDLLYYDIDGEEVSSKQLSEWKSDGLKQADYTRKTQELSDSRKDFEAEVDAFKDKQSKFDSHIATLEAMISEDVLSDEDLKELREYEPEKYIEYTEKMSSRKEFIDKNKSTKTDGVKFDANAEKTKFWDNNPNWVKEGIKTKVFASDMKAIQIYADTNGYTNDDFSAFKANEWQTLLDAAKYKALNNKNAAIEKKVRKAPVTTKPRAKANNSMQSEIDIVQKRFNKTGSDKDFLLLRKLQRQLK